MLRKGHWEMEGLVNTGGSAFPVTLLDWFAGQALAGSLASQSKESHWAFATVEDDTADDRATKGICALCYDLATAMLAEKVRRDAVVQESSTTDHSGDANKMVELEAQNRELVERIKRLEDAGNDLVWWFCQGELLQQLSPVQTSALKQWRDLRGRRNP